MPKAQRSQQSQTSKDDRAKRLDPNNEESKKRLEDIRDIFKKQKAGKPLTAAETALYNFVREQYKKVPDFKIEDISFGKHEKILNEVLKNNSAFNKLNAERKAEGKGQTLSVDEKLNLARSVLEKELSGKPLTEKEQKLAKFIHEQFHNDQRLRPEDIDKRFLEQSKSLQQIVSANKPFELNETNGDRNRARAATTHSTEATTRTEKGNDHSKTGKKEKQTASKQPEKPIAGKDEPVAGTVAAEIGRVSGKMGQIYAQQDNSQSAQKSGKKKGLQQQIANHAAQNASTTSQQKKGLDPATIARLKQQRSGAR